MEDKVSPVRFKQHVRPTAFNLPLYYPPLRQETSPLRRQYLPPWGCSIVTLPVVYRLQSPSELALFVRKMASVG